MAKQEVGTALAERPEVAVAHAEDVTTAQLVRLAESGKIDIDTLERLVAMKERAEARSARDEFNEALAGFQDECPQIARTGRADFVNKKGTRTEYGYAPLEEIARVIRPILRKHGLSWTSDMEVQQAGFIKATVHVRHVAGHSESASFTVPTETNASMSAQQKYGAAATYAQRRALTSALGITTADEDTDGAEAELNPDPITPEQEATITALGKELGAAFPVSRFLEFFGVASVSQIPASRYQEAIAMLEQKRARVG